MLKPLTAVFIILLITARGMAVQYSPQFRMKNGSDKTRASRNITGFTLLHSDGSVSTSSNYRDLSTALNDSTVVSIHSSKTFHPLSDSMISATNTENVHTGANLKQKYKGEGVIIGIVDCGFDYTHPALRKENGHSRILSVWDQRDSTGVSPVPFEYGTELKTQEELFAQQHDVHNGSHGTMISTIAGGTVIPEVPYYGIAPLADFIFVSTTYESHAIIDAVDYIFTEAEKRGKRAVVNLSLASATGPHDGTSMVDRGIDQNIHRGIIVCSASNSGAVKQHIKFPLNNDTLKTYTSLPWRTTELDFWGENGQYFELNLTVVDTLGTIIHKLPAVTVNTELFDTTLLVGSDSITIKMAGDPASTLNSKPEIALLYSVHSGSLYASHDVELAINGTPGVVHGWNGMYSSFNSRGKSGYVDGDHSYTLGDGPGTSFKPISVAASTSKKNYENWLGDPIIVDDTSQIGGIAFFSSRGPTVDGRDRPNITAPGKSIISAVNSYQENLDSSKVSFFYEYEGRRYPYSGAQGTSQSSPVVAGAVALMLEAMPSLSNEMALKIMDSTAVSDHFVEEQFRWGAGKLDVDAAVALAEKMQSELNIGKPTTSPNSIDITFSNRELTLSNLTAKRVGVKIYSLSGRELFATEKRASNGSIKVKTPDIASGVYLYKIMNHGTEIAKGRLVIR